MHILGLKWLFSVMLRPPVPPALGSLGVLPPPTPPTSGPPTPLLSLMGTGTGHVRGFGDPRTPEDKRTLKDTRPGDVLVGTHGCLRTAVG